MLQDVTGTYVLVVVFMSASILKELINGASMGSATFVRQYIRSLHLSCQKSDF